MPTAARAGKRSRSAPPAARAAATAENDAAGPAANFFQNELEDLPSDKGYESLDDNDGPPRPSAWCLVLEDEELVGLEEHAPKENPDGEPPDEAAAAAVLAGFGDPGHAAPPPANAVPSAAHAAPPGPPLPGLFAATPIGPEEAERFSPRRRTEAAAAQPSPTRAATVATGAPAAAKKLTAAQEKSQQSAAEWCAWDVKQTTPLRFGRPEFLAVRRWNGPGRVCPDAHATAGFWCQIRATRECRILRRGPGGRAALLRIDRALSEHRLTLSL